MFAFGNAGIWKFNMVTLMSSWYNLLKHRTGHCREQGADGEVLFYNTCGKHIPHEKKPSEITMKYKYPCTNNKTAYLKTNITDTESASFFHKQWQTKAIKIWVTKPVHTVRK